MPLHKRQKLAGRASVWCSAPVDGGLVDNVPVDEVRARCQADIVIAVNIGLPLMRAEEVGSLLTVSVQMVNILTEWNVTR